MLKKILIVDDSAINRAILHRMLAGDYEVLQAENGQAALDCLRQTNGVIAAVLLDIMMPVMDGYTLLTRIRADEMLCDIPVIITTGCTETDAEVRALALGANDFISKPYSSAIIRHRLQNAVSLRESTAVASTVRHDDLTGLYNRKYFFEAAAALIAAHEPSHYVMACLNIDHFKVVNDQYGTQKGDSVLREIGQILLEGFSPAGGVCARIMADHFAVLYPRAFMDSEAIRQIRHALAVLDGSIQPITFSIGCYIVDDRSLAASAMYDRASLAQASVKGRYDVHIALYDESMRERILHEQQIVNEMHGALEAGQFECWLQPQYRLESGVMVGCEALVRWRHPLDGLLIAPGAFIPVFERNGFIYELDQFIWEQACKLLRRWLDGDMPVIPISVNVSRCDVFREDFYEVITGLVEAYALPIDLLRLEITESAFAKSTGQIVPIVRRLVERGFTVEIDDFGSGYSSLNTLKSVPASVLKLDMRFLEDEGDSNRGKTILDSIVRMASRLGMPVIAEGVETQEQAAFLQSVDCRYVQGYLYAKPLQISEFEALAAQTKWVPACVTAERIDIDRRRDAEASELLAKLKEYAKLFFDAAAHVYSSIVKIDLRSGRVYRLTFEHSVPEELFIDTPWEECFRQFLLRVHPDDRAEVLERSLGGRLADIPAGSSVNFTYRSRRYDSPDSAYRWYRTTLHAAMADEDAPLNSAPDSATMFTADVNDDMLERARLKDLSEHDGLTDLFNRVKFDAMLQSEYRMLRSCGVLFFDINDLKHTNDTSGHEAGTALLCRVADSIRSITSRRIHGYRYGGDEFIVVACDTSEYALDRLIQMWSIRLGELFADTGLSHPVAVGRAWSDSPVSVEALIRAADEDMYRNKAKMKRDELDSHRMQENDTMAIKEE